VNYDATDVERAILVVKQSVFGAFLSALREGHAGVPRKDQEVKSPEEGSGGEEPDKARVFSPPRESRGISSVFLATTTADGVIIRCANLHVSRALTDRTPRILSA
jgi:hypothetical protein